MKVLEDSTFVFFVLKKFLFNIRIKQIAINQGGEAREETPDYPDRPHRRRKN